MRDGDDWIIPNDDPKLIAGPDPVLQTAGAPVPLAADFFEKIAADFLSGYLSEIEAWRERNPPPPFLKVNDQFGVRSHLQEIHNIFFRADRRELAAALVGQILPFMHKSLGATYVAPLKISF
ncbi:hypothetical protein, partial [Candidatus Binatus sp.]|uniref:hypothetical protein n=1 Tax=Candidatus Binatus sp. TaxID=2811406 RepID=UPI003CC6DBF3